MTFQSFLLAASAALPLLFAGCASKPLPPSKPPVPEVKLHPESAAWLKAHAVNPTAPSGPETPAALPKEIQVGELKFESGGKPHILRLYRKAGDTNRRLPVVLLFHGADPHPASFCAGLALGADVAVASPEPGADLKSPWPEALNVALAAYNCLCANADELNIDPARIFLEGDGAGSFPALAAAKNEFETTGEKPAGLLLFYPLVSLLPDTRASVAKYGNGFGFDAKSAGAFIQSWIPDSKQREELSPLETDASGLPPTLIVLAECDIWHDQGVEFGVKLRLAGVPVRIRCYNGAIHGFLTREGLDAFRKQAVRDAASFVSAAVSDGSGGK